MRGLLLIGSAVAAIAAASASTLARTTAQPATLPAPGFHHLHLNSVNPEAAIAFYAKQFPTTSPGTFAGQPALRSPNNVWVLFNTVDAPPPTQPATAFWHFGWHVTDVRKSLAQYRAAGVTLLPLYTGDAGRTVFVSSDTWPGTGGVLGVTLDGIAEAKAKGVKPAGGGGFAYLRGPDDALIEYQGNQPAERFNHVHMFQDQPYCAQIWFETRLNAPPPTRTAANAQRPERTEANCRVERSATKTFPALDARGMYRTESSTSTRFGDVSLFWYMNQGDTAAAPTRGQLMDHIALSVADLDAWIARLKAAQVTFLEQPYTIGDLRAVMIEGPSREAIELVEVKPSGERDWR
jgi:catechol 2,3-dioxygenase-like lactoylglutathione lyase family enzyme